MERLLGAAVEVEPPAAWASPPLGFHVTPVVWLRYILLQFLHEFLILPPTILIPPFDCTETKSLHYVRCTTSALLHHHFVAIEER